MTVHLLHVSRELQAELVERVRHAVALPLRIEIKTPPEGEFTELLVTAFLDSGGRGRPRVTYDVTTALSSLGEEESLATVDGPYQNLCVAGTSQ